MQQNIQEYGILDEAKDMGLVPIEITHSGGSYPLRMGDWGITGFEEFKDAQLFAKKFGGEVGEFFKKVGWDLWNYKGSVNKGYNYLDYLNSLGENYSVALLDNSDYAEQLVEIARDFKGDFDALDEKIAAIKQIIEEVENADVDEEVVIIVSSKYFETVKKQMIAFKEDNNIYVIGVFFNKSTLSKYLN